MLWCLQLRGRSPNVVNARMRWMRDVTNEMVQGDSTAGSPPHWSLRPVSLPSATSSPRPPGARIPHCGGQDVGVVSIVHTTTPAARAPYSLGQDRWMESWSSGGVAATAGVFPLSAPTAWSLKSGRRHVSDTPVMRVV